MAETAQDDASTTTQIRRSPSRRKWYLLALALFFVVIGVAYAIYYFAIASSMPRPTTLMWPATTSG